MRLNRLTAALAVAATTLALAPAGASAAGFRHLIESGAGGCRIGSIYAEPHLITSGEAVEIFGQAACNHGISDAGHTVTVWERAAGTAGVKLLGTATTEVSGFYSIVQPSLTTNAVFYATVGGVRSASRSVKVSPVVTLSGPAEGTDLRTGPHNRVTFSGTVSPYYEGDTWSLQRENAAGATEEWRVIQRGFVGPGGRYSITHDFVVPGDANLRVVVHPPRDTYTFRGFSNTLSYEISQAQNPRLTIHSSLDPAPYGSPVTISGILAGGADAPVTLLGHGRGTSTFTTIEKATTNGAGEYKFVIPSAAQNTFYRVSGGGVSSAVLFEGVKYLLTAGVSATKVQSGGSITFGGTVTPGHAGPIVYLERQNTFGGGYHVVDVTSANPATGTYSITYGPFGTGTQVYRVRVPGNPENQATSYPPFTIEVTPAPPALLRPVTPPTLPTEGTV